MNLRFSGALLLIFQRSGKYLRSNPHFIPGLFLLIAFFYPSLPARLDEARALRVYSAEGALLRVFHDTDAPLVSQLPLQKYPESLQYLLLLSEDRRFFDHIGFDIRAMASAAYTNLSHLSIKRGASTITQQLVRTYFQGKVSRNKFIRKLQELYYAVRFELRFNKAQILGAYLNTVSLPGNIAGFGQGANHFFSRDVSLLSPEEEAILVILVRQGALNKYKLAARAARLLVISGQQVNLPELLAASERALGKKKRIVNANPEHAAEWLKSFTGNLEGTLKSTISFQDQQLAYKIISNEIQMLKEYNADQAAVVIIKLNCAADNQIQVLAGSSNYHDPNAGQFNHAIAVRSAGSSLKPLLYAAGIDQDLFRGNTLFDDQETFLRTDSSEEYYRAQNNDMQYWGKLTLREALLTSRNIPAVQAAEKIGVRNFAAFLHRLQFDHLSGAIDKYGPGIALGNAGASLLQLTNAYTILPCNGKFKPLYLGERSAKGKLYLNSESQMIAAETADIVTHILADKKFRTRAYGNRSFLDMPFASAAKTGTSKDYHDAWTIGYTNDHVIGVWTGNSQNKPMRQVSGVWGAGRIYQQVMRALVKNRYRNFTYNSGVREVTLCRISGKYPQKNCPTYTELLPVKDELPPGCVSHGNESQQRKLTEFKVLSPLPGEVYLSERAGKSMQVEVPVIFSHAHQGEPCTWKINSQSPRSCNGPEKNFVKLRAGQHVLTVMRRGEIIEQIEFVVR